MHPTTWKASGHVDAFNDPLIDNKDSKLRYRADSLVEEYCEKLDNKIMKEISKAKKRFGKDFDEKKFIETNPKVNELKKKVEKILNRLNTSLEKSDLNDVRNLIIELKRTYCLHSDQVSNTGVFFIIFCFFSTVFLEHGLGFLNNTLDFTKMLIVTIPIIIIFFM